MSISPIGAQSALSVKTLVTMRNQLNDLQRQLSTGQKSANYAGLGLSRGLTVSLKSQLSAISGYGDTIDNVMTRTSLMTTALGRMTDITSEIKAAMLQANTANGTYGATVAQQTARTSLDELVGLLNTQAGDRYLFSGRATGQPAVVGLDEILNGSGAKAGLKQLISERTQADLGASGLGRLTLTPAGTSVGVAEDSATSPFGFKIASVTSNLTNATLTGPAGSPKTFSVNFTGLPAAGDTITMRFNLPDGTSENLTLTATTNSPPGANQFTIGASAAATAANFNTALNTALGTLAATSLTAASAIAASNDFFAADLNNPPQRVSGPPFNTATAMTAGTAANSVIWYTGEDDGSPARATAGARIDQSLAVSYGARANEDGIRMVVQNVATLAAVDILSSNPNASELSRALNTRLGTNLSDSTGQTVVTIQMELAGAQRAVASAKTRHQETAATLNDFLRQIEGVSNEEVGAKILALQTRLQASMQTTAMLFQITLVNFLK